MVLAAVPLAFCPTVQRKPVRLAKAVHELVYELAGLGALGALGRTACRAAAHAEFCRPEHTFSKVSAPVCGLYNGFREKTFQKVCLGGRLAHNSQVSVN